MTHELYPDSYYDVVELEGVAAERAALEWLDPKADDRILDVGCGRGRFMEAIEKTGAETVGIEFFTFPLEQARKRVKGELHLMSAEKISFPDSSFNKILCYHVIEHLEHPEFAFAEMHRLLRDKGRLLLSFPNSNYLPFRLGLLKQSPQHLQRFTPSLKPQGFIVLKKRVFRLGYNVVMLLENDSG